MRPKTQIEPMLASAAQRLRRMPIESFVTKLRRRYYDEYDAAHKTVRIALTAEQKAERLNSYRQHLTDILEKMNASAAYIALDALDALDADNETAALYKAVCKADHYADKDLRGRAEKTVRPTSAATANVHWYLMNVVCRKQFEIMAQTEPQAFLRHVSGELAQLTVTTSTEWLAEKTGLDTSSIRGERAGSIYRNLEILGVIECRRQEGYYGVELIVNTKKWFWGYEDPAILHIHPVVGQSAPSESPVAPQVGRGNSTQINYSFYLSKQITNESGFGYAENESAPCGATPQAEGDVSYTLTAQTPNKANYSAAPAEAPAASPVVIKTADKLLKSAVSQVFNDKNFADLKIRTNAEHALSFISPHSLQVCFVRMQNIVSQLLSEGMPLADIVKNIENDIKKTAADLTEGKKAYVFGPEMWLRQDLKRGTLWSHIATPTPSVHTLNPTPHNRPLEVPTATDTAQFAAVEWLKAQGLHPAAVAHYQKKHGADALFWFVELKKAKLTFGGFKPRKSVVQWLGNGLKYLDTRCIEADARRFAAKLLPKPGHIWEKWKAVVLSNTHDPAVIQAWHRAKATQFSDNRTLTVELHNRAHFAALEAPESVRCLRLAFEKTGMNCRIEYKIPNS